MSGFLVSATKAIHQYKKIMRKKLPPELYKKQVQAFGIKRLQLRDMSEVALLRVLEKIIAELEEHHTAENYPRLYSGINEFTDHLKNIIKNHHIENNKVVNLALKATALTLEVIQQLSVTPSKRTPSSQKKLVSSIEKILQHGSTNEINLVLEALKKHDLKTNDLYVTLIQKIEKHLKKTGCVDTNVVAYD